MPHFETEVHKLRRDLPVRPVPHVRMVRPFRWQWWVTAGDLGNDLGERQYAMTEHRARKRARAAADAHREDES
jgi:hypothetical protein